MPAGTWRGGRYCTSFCIVCRGAVSSMEYRCFALRLETHFCSPAPRQLELCVFAHSRSRRSLPALDSLEFCVDTITRIFQPSPTIFDLAFSRRACRDTSKSGLSFVASGFLLQCNGFSALLPVSQGASIIPLSPDSRLVLFLVSERAHAEVRRCAGIPSAAMCFQRSRRKKVTFLPANSRTAFGLFRRGIAIRRGIMYCS